MPNMAHCVVREAPVSPPVSVPMNDPPVALAAFLHVLIASYLGILLEYKIVML